VRPLRFALLGLAAVLLAGAAGTVVARTGQDTFDHWQHRRLFPSCEGCHAGIRDSARAVWPAAAACAVCHDGRIERRVDWSPPAAPSPPPSPKKRNATPARGLPARRKTIAKETR